MTSPAAAEPVVPVALLRLRDLVDLTKPRLSALVMLTALVGFLVASPASPAIGPLAVALLGIGLVVGGANALNQYAERELDALMSRTRERPLPAGRLSPLQALAFGILVSVAGFAWLLLLVNTAAAAVAALAWGSYVLVYTPLKLRTSLAALVGAVPGALPPVIGWAAARGAIAPEAWSLFAIVFFWQLPHFLAISALYREEYGRAGFRMVAVLDPDGRRTARQSLVYTLLTVPAALSPWFLGLAGPVYLAGAVVLNILLLVVVVAAAARPGRPQHRRVFVTTLLYLSILMTLLVFDRLPT